MMNHEVEWQFDADSLAAVEGWLRERARAGDLQFHFLTPETQRDIYFDSPDWRVYRAGYGLRMRVDAARHEATLKSLKSLGKQDGSLKVRREINERLDLPAVPRDLGRLIGRAPGAVGGHVRNVVGKQKLRRLFELLTERHRVLVRREGLQIAEIALDDVHVASRVAPHPHASRAALTRVEVEAVPSLPADSDAMLRALVEEIHRACKLRPAALSKLEAGLSAQGITPGLSLNLGQPDTAEDAGGHPATGDLAFAVLRQHFAAFVAREPGVRMGEDAEDVHRMRVATRKLRAAMGLFRDYLPADAERLRGELGWIADALGSVRDLDVQLERAQAWHGDDETLDASALRGLQELLRGMREPARARLLRAFNSARYAALLNDYEAMLVGGPTGDLAARPARVEMPSLILKRYLKVREGGDAIDDDSPADELHALRIQCKRLRYALEFATPLYPKAIRNFLPRLVELQDVLGEHQDAYVAIEQMRGLGTARGGELPAQTLAAFNDIAQRYAVQAQELRAQFAKLYRRLKGKAWQQIQRALDAT